MEVKRRRLKNDIVERWIDWLLGFGRGPRFLHAVDGYGADRACPAVIYIVGSAGHTRIRTRQGERDDQTNMIRIWSEFRIGNETSRGGSNGARRNRRERSTSIWWRKEYLMGHNSPGLERATGRSSFLLPRARPTQACCCMRTRNQGPSPLPKYVHVSAYASRLPKRLG